MKYTYFLLFVLLFSTTVIAQKPEVKLRMNHLAIVVSDLDKSADFYMDVLLMEEIKNETGNPKIRWFSFADKRELHLLEGDLKNVSLNKSIHFALSVSNLQAYVDYLKKLDYPFESWYGDKMQTNDRPDGVKQIYLQDPDGYWIEVNDDKL